MVEDNKKGMRSWEGLNEELDKEDADDNYYFNLREDKSFNYYESSFDTVGKMVSSREIKKITTSKEVLALVKDIRTTKNKRRRATLLKHMPLIYQKGLELPDDIQQAEDEDVDYDGIKLSDDVYMHIKGVPDEGMDALYAKHEEMIDNIKDIK